MSERDDVLLAYLSSRADNVETFAEAYAQTTAEADAPTLIIASMICDLMHLADFRGGTGQRVLAVANARYENERSGDEVVMNSAEGARVRGLI